NDKTGLYWSKGSGANPYPSLGELSTYWAEPENTEITWKAPDGIYWVCGKKAYSKLPQNGSCTLGMIQSVFFTLPRSESSLLGAPL
ncbi:ENR1 protein, partial [Erithacus rubecula]|nr:ENR1 protein [Erithacus rubecula]